MFNSKLYWEKRYRDGGNSGAGSYNELATFKSNIINEFIKKNNIGSIIDYGVGDGNVLKLLNIFDIEYYGIDVSPTVIENCKKIFNDKNIKFFTVEQFDHTTKADLCLSCDVLFHLIEDDIYYEYIDNLFKFSNKFVIIYAKDEDKNHTVHVKFRKFSDYILNKYQKWELIEHIPNTYKESPSDFYVYKITTTKEIINSWYAYIEKNLLHLLNSDMEGNIYSSHKTIQKNALLISKQNNIVEFITTFKPTNILEIGFNSGFSALLMKITKPDVNLTCIDINIHPYVIPCYNTISKDYKNIRLITENSSLALPKLVTQKIIFDVIHIDGDHRIETAGNDLKLSLKLSKKGTVIIFDDTNMKHLNDLCDEYVNKGILKDYIFNKMEGTVYKHRFLQVI